MPIRRRSSNTLATWRTFWPPTRTVPSTRAEPTKSIVRLMHRSRVVLPELAGPMMPKISFGGIESETSFSAWCPS